MAESALSGLRVVELGDFIAAPYCTKLMADLGAEVIKVEPPGAGDSARRYGPFPNDEPHLERSLLFAYMNTSKMGVTLDVRKPLGKRAFKELLKDADVLVEGNPPKVMEELGLDYNSIKDINPGLIVTSITAFGQTGPYRDYKATELVSFHIGGLGYGTPGEIEEPETHPPLKAAGHQGNVQAGITAASATMCALFARDFSGQGQHVDVSIQEPLLSAIGSDIIAHTNRKETPTRIAALALRVPGRKPFLAKDGYVTLTMVQDHFWESLKKVLGYPEWAESEIFNEREARRDNMDALYPLVEEWTQQHTMEELYQMLQVEGHIPSSPVHSVEAVINHPHFVERGTFVDMEHSQIGEFKSPGPAYRFSETPWQVSSPAPILGQHNEEVLCNKLGYSKDDLARMRQMGVI